MPRIARIAFLVTVTLALTIVAGFDLRLALASRELAIETTAALDEHERRLNGTSAVTTSTIDEHERRAAAFARATVTSEMPSALDEHERRALRPGLANTTSSVPAAVDEHERRARTASR